MTANDVLSEAQRREVEAAIGEVEKGTSAEVVCAVATESGRYDRAEAIVGLMAGLAALCGVHAVLAGGAGDWSAAGLPLAGQALAVVVGFVAGNVLASYVHGLRRLAVSERELTAEVERAASHVFALAAVGSTAGRTGLLVYVSLFERRVVVLADSAAREALGDEGIEALRDTAVAHLRRGELPETFQLTVEQAGTILAEKMPAEREANPDELANRVLVFHPRP